MGEKLDQKLLLRFQKNLAQKLVDEVALALVIALGNVQLVGVTNPLVEYS